MPEVQGPLRLRFTGSGQDYFRLWIVNLALTIVTLGVYSAWAKVQREKYFYQHTTLANSSFDYHGSPWAILAGRLLSITALSLTQFDFVGRPMRVGAWVALGLALPWLLQRSRRFRLANTSYRGLRFRFTGTVRDAYTLIGGFVLLVLAIVTILVMVLAGRAAPFLVLLVPVLLCLLYPLLHARWRRYAMDHAHFGNLEFHTVFRAREFLAVYVSAASLWFLAALPALVLVAMVGSLDDLMERMGLTRGMFNALAALLGALLAYAMASSLWPYISARVQNLCWNRTRIGSHPMASNLMPGDYVKLQLKNLALTVLTLGLYRPFAAVATARMRLDSITLSPETDFEAMLAAITSRDDQALGSEALDLLGFDISL